MGTDGGNRVRASDAEREEYGAILRAAMSEGRLTLQEGEERLGRVFAATYRDELPALTGDLPDGGRQAVRDTPEVREQWQRAARRHFAGHAGMVAVITAVLVGLWAVSHAHFFWPAIPLMFLLFSLLRAARFRRFASSGPPWARGGPWQHHHHGHRGGPGFGGPGFGGWAGDRGSSGPRDEGWGPRPQSTTTD